MTLAQIARLKKVLKFKRPQQLDYLYFDDSRILTDMSGKHVKVTMDMIIADDYEVSCKHPKDAVVSVKQNESIAYLCEDCEQYVQPIGFRTILSDGSIRYGQDVLVRHQSM